MAKVGKSWQKLAKVGKSCKRRSKLITVAKSCQRLPQFGKRFKELPQKLPKNSQRWSWLSCLELTKLHVVHWTTSPLEYSWAATIYATRYPTRYPDFFLLPYPNPTRSQKTLPVPACCWHAHRWHCRSAVKFWYFWKSCEAGFQEADAATRNWSWSAGKDQKVETH